MSRDKKEAEKFIWKCVCILEVQSVEPVLDNSSVERRE